MGKFELEKKYHRQWGRLLYFPTAAFVIASIISAVYFWPLDAARIEAKAGWLIQSNVFDNWQSLSMDGSSFSAAVYFASATGIIYSFIPVTICIPFGILYFLRKEKLSSNGVALTAGNPAFVIVFTFILTLLFFLFPNFFFLGFVLRRGVLVVVTMQIYASAVLSGYFGYYLLVTVSKCGLVQFQGKASESKGNSNGKLW